MLSNLQSRTNSTDPLLLALAGVAMLRGPDVQIERAAGYITRPAHPSSNAEREGVRLLSRIAMQTGWAEAARELAEASLATRRAESLTAAADVLAALEDPSLWMLLAEVHLARGDHDAARLAAERSAASGDAQGLRTLGILSMLSRDDAASGADQYLNGLANATGDQLRPFIDDLRGILTAEELNDWMGLPPSGRSDWIRRKWEWRAAMAGIAISERLAEHHQRLKHISTAYRRRSHRGAHASGATWNRNSDAPQPFDDRGLIYLRHGPPDVELRMRKAEGEDPPSRVGWGYNGVGGRTVYEFDRTSGSPDYFLAAPYPICSGKHVITLRRAGSDYSTGGDLTDWAASLHRFDPGLAMYYSACDWREPESLAHRYLQVRADVQKRIDQARDSETATGSFPEPMPFMANLYAFADGYNTRLVAYLAVPAGILKPDTAARGLTYGLDVLFSVGDPVSELVEQVDTVVMFSPTTPMAGDAVVGMPIPLTVHSAESARVVIAIRNQYNDSQGELLTTSRTVPDLSPGSFGLSDIVIAHALNGTLVRGEHRLAPIAGHAVPTGRPFRIYYELYGAEQGSPYQVSIAVVPSTEGGVLSRIRSLISQREAMWLDFPETADPDSENIVRSSMEVSADLEPGSYTVVVTIRDLRTNASTSSSTNLLVHGV